MSQRWNRPKVTFSAGSSTQSQQPPCKNPLFEQWLMEWREDAAKKNSKMQYVYGKALASLRKYPLKLSSGKDCLLLEFFGVTMCKMIDARMVKENITLDSGQPDDEDVTSVVDYQGMVAGSKSKKRQKQTNDDEKATCSKKIRGKGKSYVPAHRSGGYAVLVTLLKKEETPNYRGYMLKSELCHEAQSYCDSSFTKSDNPGSNYTAWSTMKGLLTKELVLKQGHPAKFMLTMEGRELATKLVMADGSLSTGSNDEEECRSLSSGSSFHRTTLEPGRFEVILCVDTSETTAKCKKEEVIGELRKNGVSLEVVRLSVGDFAWVVRETAHVNGNNRRLTISKGRDMILPFIVERKRSDDLASSIKDGRFHEQKHRLEKTGLKPIYLIEAHGNGDWGLADGALSQALANTQMTNGFLIQETANIKETCAYLTHMTRHLANIYGKTKITSCTKEEWPSLKDSTTNTYMLTFSDFNEFGIKLKNWTVTEMFARQLMRLRGLSVERAYAIVQKYPTLQSIMSAYSSCATEKEKELLVANIYYGTSGKTVGPAISRALCKLYNSRDLQ